MPLIYGDSVAHFGNKEWIWFSASWTSHFCLLLLHINTQVRSEILPSFPCLVTLTFIHRASQTWYSQCPVHWQDHLCALQPTEFQFPTHIYILFAFSFLLLHKLIDWMIIPQWLTHLGAQHLDMFPFSACSQEPSYIVSGELHLPPSTSWNNPEAAESQG